MISAGAESAEMPPFRGESRRHFSSSPAPARCRAGLAEKKERGSPGARDKENTLMAAERKTAIVTGAASGLGRAMALGLVGSGMDVVAVDQNESALATLAPAKKGGAGSILPVPADLVQPDAFARIAAAAMDALGR